jgi:Putative transposase of IS4/5 family (DUF4096)
MTTVDLVPDQLWNASQPLLPPEPPKPKGGRPRVPDRAVLGGIVFMLRAGLPWRLLPARELGVGSPVTWWRRLRDWQAARVWQQRSRARGAVPAGPANAPPSRTAQSLRLRTLPAGIAPAGHHAQDRPARDQAQPEARPLSMGGRAVAGLAGQSPPPRGAL